MSLAAAPVSEVATPLRVRDSVAPVGRERPAIREVDVGEVPSRAPLIEEESLIPAALTVQAVARSVRAILTASERPEGATSLLTKTEVVSAISSLARDIESAVVGGAPQPDAEATLAEGNERASILPPTVGAPLRGPLEVPPFGTGALRLARIDTTGLHVRDPTHLTETWSQKIAVPFVATIPEVPRSEVGITPARETQRLVREASLTRRLDLVPIGRLTDENGILPPIPYAAELVMSIDRETGGLTVLLVRLSPLLPDAMVGMQERAALIRADRFVPRTADTQPGGLLEALPILLALLLETEFPDAHDGSRRPDHKDTVL